MAVPIVSRRHRGVGPDESAGVGTAVLVALPGLVALALLARWGINRDPWFDEGLSVAATVQLRETLDATAYTMAAYYTQLTVWVWVSDGLGWVRALSVVHAALALVSFSGLVSWAHGRTTAWWGSLFLGTSWMMVRYAHEARSFALVVLLVTLGWWAVAKLVESPGHRGWTAVHVAVCVLAPLAHGMAVLAIGWQVLAVWVARPDRRTWWAALPGWVLAGSATVVLYRIGGSELGSPAAATTVEFVERYLMAFHGGQNLGWLWFGRWLLLALSAWGTWVGVVRLRAAGDPVSRFVAVMGPAWGMGTMVGFLALNSVRPGVHVRYAIAAVPGLALLWAVGALDLRRRLLAAGPVPRIAGRLRVVCLASLLVLLGGQVQYHERLSARWSHVVDLIAAESRPGDGIAVPGSTRPVFDVAWRHHGHAPALTSVSHVNPPGEVRRYDSARAGPDTHWLVVLTPRVWVLERVVADRPDEAYHRFVDTFLVPHDYEAASVRQFGEIRVHLFVAPDGRHGPSG